MDLKTLLENSAKLYAARIAVIQGERRVTFSELNEASNRLANVLHSLGLSKSEHVAMLMGNSPEFISVFFGIIKAGGIPIPMDTRYKAGELSRIFQDCHPVMMITEDPCLEPLLPALPQFKTVRKIIHLGQGHEGTLSYRKLMAESPALPPDVNLSPEDTATINYTSAPSNHPHGAVFTHRSLVTETEICGEWLKQTENDVVMLFALPLYHMFGLSIVMLPALYEGSTLVMVSGTGISISTLMESIQEHKGTLLFGVPYIFALAVMMAEREGVKYDLSSLRLCASGGAPLRIETVYEFKKYFGIALADIWGMTEAVSQVSGPPLDRAWKTGTIGKALPGWEVKIMDDNGQELPAGQEGEMICRGEMMSGYYNNPEATAKVIKNGWLYTGDIGKVDAEGNLYITGRKKRMIILKGQNIYPEDIEEILRTHPAVADAQVSGLPDKLRGEVVKVRIQLKTGGGVTEQEIRRFCQERMADYKLPKQIELVLSCDDN